MQQFFCDQQNYEVRFPTNLCVISLPTLASILSLFQLFAEPILPLDIGLAKSLHVLWLLWVPACSDWAARVGWAASLLCLSMQENIQLMLFHRAPRHGVLPSPLALRKLPESFRPSPLCLSFVPSTHQCKFDRETEFLSCFSRKCHKNFNRFIFNNWKHKNYNMIW